MRASEDTLRRRLFHGWAFQDHRTAEQKEALRYWLNDGLIDDRRAEAFHPDDRDTIARFAEFKSTQK